MIKMNEKKFSMGFHRMLIYGFLWFYAVVMIAVAGHNIMDATGDRISGMVPLTILQVIQIASACLLIKARFDLAKWRKIALNEILICALVSAVIYLIDWRVHVNNGDLLEKSYLFPLCSACWGIAIYRYYKQFDGLFAE